MTDNQITELLREFAENAIYCNQFGSLYADEERIAEYAERIEQAIAATLGSGTCEMEYGGNITLDTARVMGVYFCSECGSPIYNDYMPHFCGYCGKAVKR